MEEIVASAAARTNGHFEAVARQVDINLCACRLGDYYALGQFVPQDAAKAIYWYEKAKDAPHAQFQIGFVNLTQTRNYPEAAKWLTKAAEAVVASQAASPTPLSTSESELEERKAIHCTVREYALPLRDWPRFLLFAPSAPIILLLQPRHGHSKAGCNRETTL